MSDEPNADPRIETNIEDGKLTITRVFDAPRELVFEAWTTPAIMVRWWGCAQTEHVDCEVDLRVGGTLRITMRSSVYGVMDKVARITELDPPRRYAYQSDPEAAPPGAPPDNSHIGVTFEDLGEQTRVTLVHSGIPDDVFIGKMITGGWSAAFGKLSKHIEPATA